MDKGNETIMGIQDRESKSKRPPQNRKAFTREREQFDTTTIWSEEFKDALEIALAEGGAIRLGLTRDGGALAVGIYGLGTEPSTEYVRPSDDIGEFWRQLTSSYKGNRDL